MLDRQTKRFIAAMAVVLVIVGLYLAGRSGAIGISSGPPPASVQLFSASGSGIQNTGTFTASGSQVDVAWTYSCNPKGLFVVDLVASDTYRFGVVNVVGTGASGSTFEYISGDPGPYHIEVDGECNWTVTVTGQP